MIGLPLLAGMAVDTAAVQPSNSDAVFACQYFQPEPSDDWVHVVDMRAVKHADASWTLERPSHRAVTAKSFDARHGSLESFLTLRWQENRREKRAYLSFANIALPDGIRLFRLNFDQPPPWKAPGYICQSDGKGAGTVQ